MDYLVNAQALIHGLDQKTYDVKVKGLTKAREKMVGMVTQDAYNFDGEMKAKEREEKAREAGLLTKVAKMGQPKK